MVSRVFTKLEDWVASIYHGDEVAILSRDGSQHSEEMVFKAFADGLPDDWLVIYSRRLLQLEGERYGAWQGEADFVIFHPRRGLIVLEVKGGIEVGRDRNGCCAIDHPNFPSISSNPAAWPLSGLANLKIARSIARKLPSGQ